MAKLYWRVKKDGKWTWKPAENQVVQVEIKPNLYVGQIYVQPFQEEEE